VADEDLLPLQLSSPEERNESCGVRSIICLTRQEIPTR
jgi:hypothetical protein